MNPAESTPKNEEKITIENTRSPLGNSGAIGFHLHTGTRFFGQEDDAQDSRFCFATLFDTYLGFPTRVIATYRLLKTDRNTQTWNVWSWKDTLYVNRPEAKTLPGERVELHQAQIRCVRRWYTYLPLAILGIGALSFLWGYLFGPESPLL